MFASIFKINVLREEVLDNHNIVFQQGFGGDGMECRPAVPCSENPNVCDENAECLRIERPIRPSNDGISGPQEFGCKCKNGFLGDGYSCSGDKPFIKFISL